MLRRNRWITFITILTTLLLVPVIALSAQLSEIMADAKDGKLDSVSLTDALLLMDKTTAGEASQLKAKIDSAVTEHAGSAKDADAILKSMKTKLFKQYWPGSTLASTFAEGKFDPLWGTALYVLTLTKAGIDCQVIETAANYIVVLKEAGSEVMYDVIAGKNPVKGSIEDYLTKTVGLRTTSQMNKLAPFSLNTAKRYDCCRIIAGMSQKRQLQNLINDDFADFKTIAQETEKAFTNILIDQDKIVEELVKKLKNADDPTKTVALAEIAKNYAKAPGVDKKELEDNLILAARQTYLAIKASKDLKAMDKYLGNIKPSISKDVFVPMAKEGYLLIHNSYWAKKDYVNVEKYARILWKDLGVNQAKDFWVKSQLIPANDLAKEKKFTQAMEKVDKVLKEDGKDTNAQKIREYVLQLQYNDSKDKNDYPTMLVVLEKLRVLYPQDDSYTTALIRTYWTWGKSRLDQNDFAEGIRIITEGYKKFTSYEPLKELLSTAYKNYAIVLDKQNDRMKAIDMLKRANDLFGDYDSLARNDFIAELYLRLSIQAANKGNRAEAQSMVDKCLIYAPDNEQCKAQLDNLKRGKDSVEEKQMNYAPWE